MEVHFPPGVHILGQNTVFEGEGRETVDFFVEGDRGDLSSFGKVRADICPFNLQPQTVVRVERGVPPEVYIG